MEEREDLGVSARERPNERGRSTPSAMLRVKRLQDALLPNELARLGTAELVAFLNPRRWFGAKAGAPSAARVADAIVLPWEGGRFAIARLDVTTAGGDSKRYQLPLCVRSNDEIGDALPTSIIARVVADDGEGMLFDAVEDGAFLRALADAFAHGAQFGKDDSRWMIEPLSAAPLVVPANAPLRVG